MVQSLEVQHAELAMHAFDAVQIFFPDGQPQVPPGPEQISPVTVQSLDVQQLAMAMQLAPQVFCPAGHEQEPPGPEQVCPEIGQSALVQQFAFGMQLFDAVQIL